MSEGNGEIRRKVLEYEDPILKLTPLPTPEWEPAGVPQVWIRKWGAAERDQFEIDFGDLQKPQMVNLRARILVRCLFEETGERIFQDADADVLGRKDAVVINRLFLVVAELNKIRPGDSEAALKNS